ncbi:hypothetical protein D9758_017389 [Tetrapyrgos nigripes]|uniref:Uncharacterized protein n=1 Tax=Tetrapyrgos nigripes TaxID=182062 RepID=A0A8H5C6W8_9AGAR|nr:hypothetical protein D9758_017389 [Tetrapyrgos nigripes]
MKLSAVRVLSESGTDKFASDVTLTQIQAGVHRHLHCTPRFQRCTSHPSPRTSDEFCSDPINAFTVHQRDASGRVEISR